MFELVDKPRASAIIKVIGIGGGGGNAICHMIDSAVEGVEFIGANTDAQALANVPAKTLLQLGGGITKGLGAGACPDTGRQAALEDKDRIQASLEGADMVFIAAGMGGGTGTGGAPVVAEVARDLEILTVAVVTRPFSCEGRKRIAIAEDGIRELRQHVDSLITIPNDKLAEVLGAATTLDDAFKAADDVLLGAVRGISDVILRHGIMNVDFADVRTVMSEKGMAMMGTGSAAGEHRAREAAERAIHSPLLEDFNLEGARGVLVNITAGSDISLSEFDEVNETIKRIAAEDATMVVGKVTDETLGGELKVTLVATGMNAAAPAQTRLRVVEPPPPPPPPAADEEADAALTATGAATGGVASGATGAAAPPPPPAPRRAAVGQDEYFDIPTFLRRQTD